MKNFILSHKAGKFLDGLDATQYRQIGKRLFELCYDHFPNDSRHLKFHPGVRRIHVGEFRICYRPTGELGPCPNCDQDVVKIVVVGPRNDDFAYRELRRRR